VICDGGKKGGKIIWIWAGENAYNVRTPLHELEALRRQEKLRYDSDDDESSLS
jgi:hypothetical protein